MGLIIPRPHSDVNQHHITRFSAAAEVRDDARIVAIIISAMLEVNQPSRNSWVDFSGHSSQNKTCY